MTTVYLEHEGGRIAFEVTGRGPLVVCVPGMGDLRGEYRFLARQLVEAGFQAVAMDVRGHGESSVEWDDLSVAGIARDILALIRSLDEGPAVVVGTSMAAGAAVLAAVDAPELVSGLVLIGPAVRGEPSPVERVLYRVLFARPWGAAMWVKFYKTLYPSQQPDDFAEYTDALLSNLKEPGRLEALRRMILTSRAEPEKHLANVHAPALIVMGEKDSDFKDPNPEGEARRIVAGLRQGGAEADYILIPGAGHYPHVEMPEILGEAVMPFLTRAVRAARQLA